MAVALDHVYRGNGDVKNTVKHGYFRIRYETRCIDVPQGIWEIRFYLQAKSTGTLMTSLKYGKYTSTHFFGESGFERDTSKYKDVYLEGSGTENGYIFFLISQNKQNSSLKSFPESEIAYSLVVTYSLGTDTYTMQLPYAEYGGIDYSPPTIRIFETESITQTSLTFQYMVTAPYKMVVLARYRLGSGTESVLIAESKPSMSDAETFTITGLTPATAYSVYLQVVSETEAAAYSETLNERTTPIYVQEIQADDLNINRGNSVTLEPVALPLDATIRSFNFISDKSNVYSLSTPSQVGYYSGAVRGLNKGDGVIEIKTLDGSGVTKTVNVHVYVSATNLHPNVTVRKILIGQTYKIVFSVSPYDSTDTQVSFSSSDATIASVSSDGTVTGVSAGAAEITLKLTRFQADPLTASVIIVVGEKREWISFDLSSLTSLTYHLVDDVVNNLDILRGYINDSGAREDIVIFDNIPQTALGSAIPAYETKNVVNDLEDCFDVVMAAMGSFSEDTYGFLADARAYYGVAYTWNEMEQNPREQVERWILILNALYSYFEPEDAAENTVNTDGTGAVISVDFLDEDGDVTSSYIFGDD